MYGPGGALLMVVESAVPDWLTGPVSVKLPWPRFFEMTIVPPVCAVTPGDADIVHQPAVDRLADVNSLVIPDHLDGFPDIRRQVDRFLFPSIGCLPGIIHQRGNRAW